MPDILEVAVEAAVDAGSLLKRHFGEAQQVAYKGGVHNIVTDMDHRSEALIVERIRSAFPDHRILAEEGSTGAAEGDSLWIIDPLDGTTNYAHRFPIFAVSIGIERAGILEVGVIYAPVLDELFVARRGHGATLNGHPIRVSEVGSIELAMVSTAWSYDRSQRELELRLFNTFGPRAQSIRRLGSAALELCYVGEGRLDAFWFWCVSPWDVAAAAVITTEAGGKITDELGGPFRLHESKLVATNGLIHQEVLRLLSQGAQAHP